MAKPYPQIFEFFLNPAIYPRRVRVKGEFFGQNIFIRCWRAGKSLVGNLWKVSTIRHQFRTDLVGKRWVVVGSRNQEASTSFLVRNDAYRMVAANFYESPNKPAAINWYKYPKVFYLFAYLPFLVKQLLRQPLHFSRVFQELLHGVGVYENQLITLRLYRPEVVVVSNDHVPWYRALVLAANSLGIPTVYLQHATVVADFPSLIYDLSLLDGQDAADKYHKSTKVPVGKELIIGMPKYDDYVTRVNTSDKLRRLGIPYGFFDEVAVVAKIVKRIRQDFPELHLSIRKHPRDERPFPQLSLPEITFSDARSEPALTYLLNQDAIIASDSGVHLEAALMNVTPLYYRFLSSPKAPTDHYGFLANNLVDQLESEEALIKKLRSLIVNRPEVRNRAGYYVANLKGEFAGKSKQLALAAIEELLAE